MDPQELFWLLESNVPHEADEAKKIIHEYLNKLRDGWLVNGLIEYYMATGSVRVMDILAGVREPHEKHLFDRLYDILRGTMKFQGLTLLGHIVRRNPTWLYKITQHNLMKELLKLLRVETDILCIMNALLVLVVLLPMIAGFVAPVLQEIFEVFSRLASWNTNNPNKMSESYLLHLQVGLYLLFQQLYGMFPCNFLGYLRQEYSVRGDNMAVFSHTIKPMLDTVKMHPLLVTASKDAETSAVRWKRMEPHDVMVECSRFTIETSCSSVPVADTKPKGEVSPHQYQTASQCPRSSLERAGVIDGSNTSRGVRAYSSQLPYSSDKELWTPSLYCGGASSPLDASTSAPTSIPHTPISQPFTITSALPQQEGTSPPEAAVEATPETTPVKDMRQVSRVTPSVSSSVVRALNSTLGPTGGSCSPMHSQPSSPMKKEASPFRFPPDNCSAFQQLSRNVTTTSSNSNHSDSNQNRRDSVLSQRVQRIILERIQVTEPQPQDGKPLKPKTPVTITPSAIIQPTSPLRVISSSAWDQHPLSHLPTPNSPLLVNEMSQEDREVENMLKGVGDQAAGTSSSGNRQCDSVLQEFHHQHHHVDEEVECYEECLQESGSPCTSGGLHMPSSQSMRDFARQVSRLRYYSYSCIQGRDPGFLVTSTASSLTEGSSFPEDAKVRRAVSCPEMKKSVSVSMLSPSGKPPLDEKEEEDDKIGGVVDPNLSNGNSGQSTHAVNGHTVVKPQENVPKRKRLISSSTQTENTLQPFEQLFLNVFSNNEQHHTPPPESSSAPIFPNRSQSRMSPVQAVESFIETSLRFYDNRRTPQGVEHELKVCRDQLMLAHVQLHFERHRREVHAERNRRLLGKSRNNRALEEYNSAMKSQLATLQQERDSVQHELDVRRQETNWNMKKLQESLEYWQNQSRRHQANADEARARCEMLQQDVTQERDKTATVTNQLNESQSQLLITNNELQQAMNMLGAFREAREELRRLQRDVVVAGEMQQRSRDRLENFARSAHQAAQAALHHETYRLQLEELTQQLEQRNATIDAYRARISELESVVAERNRVIDSHKSLLGKAQSDHNEKLKDTESKYKAVCKKLSELEEQVFILTSQLETLERAQQRQSAAPRQHSRGALPGMRQAMNLRFPVSGNPEAPLRNLHALVDDAEKTAGASSMPSPDNTH